MSKRLKIILVNIVNVAAIWGLSTLFTVILKHMGVRIENLLLLYVAGVVLCSLKTGSMGWGAVAGVVFVFTFNYLFTAPVFTFQVDDPNYVVSLLIFIIVACIVASLAVKVQRQMQIANRKTEVTLELSEIGSGFLNLTGVGEIVQYSCESLEKLTGRKAGVLVREGELEEFQDGIAEWCYQNAMICGSGRSHFPGNPGLYVPVKNQNRTYGVAVLDCSQGEPQQEELKMIDSVVSQIALVLEREALHREKEESRIQIEKERLKSTLLRSISHDLKTPLTGIAGSANFLHDNYGEIDEESARGMLSDICTDAEWLGSMVENLLNMTRIQEGRLEVRRQKEVVDDLVSGACSLVSKRLGSHSLNTVLPKEIVLVSVDGRLFTQVLVNLIDNAVKHSGERTEILVSVRITDGTARFTVSDNGVGVPENRMNQIFDNFFTTAYENGDRQRGTGLGLTICKAITEAHGGSLSVYNNETGGASFQIDLPMEP